jgi:hypothetical protein
MTEKNENRKQTEKEERELTLADAIAWCNELHERVQVLEAQIRQHSHDRQGRAVGPY